MIRLFFYLVPIVPRSDINPLGVVESTGENSLEC
jgi:hypothetical protein